MIPLVDCVIGHYRHKESDLEVVAARAHKTAYNIAVNWDEERVPIPYKSYLTPVSGGIGHTVKNDAPGYQPTTKPTTVQKGEWVVGHGDQLWIVPDALFRYTYTEVPI